VNYSPEDDIESKHIATANTYNKKKTSVLMTTLPVSIFQLHSHFIKRVLARI
jgi:hypothetical protein